MHKSKIWIQDADRPEIFHHHRYPDASLQLATMTEYIDGVAQPPVKRYQVWMDGPRDDYETLAKADKWTVFGDEDDFIG